MLYDNAQLAGLYVAAFDRTGQPAYRAVAEGIFSYVLSVMTDPLGPFFSAQAADTHAIEGKYSVWSAAAAPTSTNQAGWERSPSRAAAWKPPLLWPTGPRCWPSSRPPPGPPT